MSQPSLIFVYNANSGMWNTMLDTIHKTVSPETYQCNLCRIIYGPFTEHSDWKEFRKNFKGKLKFLHIDEFEKAYPSASSYPVVLEEGEDGSLSVMMTTERINMCRDLEELIGYCRDWVSLYYG